MSDIREVAREANVAISTVSKVLNNPSFGKPETRKRVMQAVKRCGYYRNAIAKSMTTGKTNNIVHAVAILNGQFFVGITRGIESGLIDTPYKLMLFDSTLKADTGNSFVDFLLEKNADGCIVSGNMDGERLSLLSERNIPIVAVDFVPPNARCDKVLSANIDGAKEAVQLLIDRGHTRIGIISVDEYFTGRERFEGYLGALERNNIPFDPTLYVSGGFSARTGYDATRYFLAMKERPTAIFACNEDLWYGAFLALKDNNIKIPNEIAFIGFDDVQWAETLTPRVTTVLQPSFEMGAAAAKLLIRRLETNNSEPEREVVLKTSLKIRDSV